MTYIPPPSGRWETITPDAAGLDAELLKAAVDFAIEHESELPRSLDTARFLPALTADEPEPWNEIIGPIAPRGGPSGLFLRGGRIIAPKAQFGLYLKECE